jgi:hypothetical protein
MSPGGTLMPRPSCALLKRRSPYATGGFFGQAFGTVVQPGIGVGMSFCIVETFTLLAAFTSLPVVPVAVVKHNVVANTMKDVQNTFFMRRFS